MAGSSQTLDVWIVEANTVYRGVPFSVVADWVQQGRLLDEDRVRLANAPEWTRLSQFPTLAAYLPRAEPFRADDRAEALAPVQLDVGWKSKPADEDDDVDMIPLIDVSLVLLIFFMMTATVGGAGGLIPTPKTRHGSTLVNTPYWIGIDCRRDADGQLMHDASGALIPVYSLGQGDKLPDPDAYNLSSRTELLKRLDAKLSPGDEVEVRIKGHPALPFEEVIRDLTVALERFKVNKKIRKYYAEVSQRTE
jgi:biopolymer transport protein ExbD